MTVVNSILSDNWATVDSQNPNEGDGRGGAIYTSYGAFTLINSTLSGNSAVGNAQCSNCGHGGGLYVGYGSHYNRVAVLDSTITDNSATNYGGGIYLDQGEMTVGNSIVSGNTGRIGKEALAPNGVTLTSQGHNLFGANGASGLQGVTPTASDIIPPVGITLDKIIKPLVNNGGPTLTHLLASGSPALNTGDNGLIPIDPDTSQPYVTDQRGTGFPRIVSGTVDIGAVEGASTNSLPTAHTAGLFSPTTSTFYLKNSHAGGAADLVFGFGPANAGWTPLVGDWDGNGSATVGLFSPGTSTFYLKNSHAGGAADLVFGFGPANAGWKPLAGDWNGPSQ